MSVVRRIRFEYLDVDIDVVAADPSNMVFGLLVKTHLGPLSLAAELGRLTEETALQKMALIYAEAIIVGSPTPSLEQNTRADWEQWLITHPEEFVSLREICECPDNFVEEG